jgi:uncharacterized membrane protein YgcG
MRVQKWFTVLVLMAALLVAVPAFAQDEAIEEEPVELSVTGVVDAIAGTTLTVDGLDYDVAAAEITAVGVLAVGDTVTVVYFVEEEANIAVSVIEDEAEDDGEEPVEELTVTGDIEAIVGSLITVDGVDYDASTAFITAVGVLAVGDTVTIVYVVEEEVNVALSVIEDEVIVDDDDEDDDDGNAPDHSRQFGVGSKCEAEAPEGWVEYTVGEDDTLWSLAVATGSSIAQLKFPNCIQNPHDISAGDVVFLPSTPDPDAEPVHPGRGRNKDRDGEDDGEEAASEQRGNGNGNGRGNNGKGNGNGRGNGNGGGNGNGNGKNK